MELDSIFKALDELHRERAIRMIRALGRIRKEGKNAKKINMLSNRSS